MDWNPQQYLEFADERGRPFLDLLGRVRAQKPRRVVDVGCGPGNLTALLAARWPDAIIEGIDSSPQMVAQASAVPGVDARLGDATEFQPPTDCDVLISNATLQWVPDHPAVIARWAEALPTGGWLAFQVPDNFGAPSHQLMRSRAKSPRWRDQLGGVLRHHDTVARPGEYGALLRRAGLRTDVWQTTYLHLLEGADPVLKWVRGTGLRPVLQALSASDAAEFEQEYAAELRAAYPSDSDGRTTFPFTRTFCVGYKP
ncbi:trans-aconitate 2-methyltransferase [Jatrophihabitans sp. GAS493]|uniref:trans-aconitate 2-methyltransferase n=1 Tax=Jatrophihabitans sp. GAS493 TaxID=1907575 RepID=UPI000BB7E4E9|nr:trans-aconitate 2-methyltransferase [Jatrophihabitans sp. GAS493]SOD72066.1 trans-aconitate 2-methyltransferase [Jatrophihabitans sp. GAS493]